MLSNDGNGAMGLKKERNQLEEMGLKHASCLHSKDNKDCCGLLSVFICQHCVIKTKGI